MGATQEQIDRLIEILGQIRWVLALGLLCLLIAVLLAIRLAIGLSKAIREAAAAGVPVAGTASSFRERMQNLLDRGRYDEMIASLGETLKEFPDHLDARYYLAHVYARKREWDLARRQAEEIKRIYPPWADSLNELIKQTPEPDRAVATPTPDAVRGHER